MRNTKAMPLVQAESHPLNKFYIDLSGSNNPIGEYHESNRAKTERFYINSIFARGSFHKNHRSLHMKS